MHVFGQIKAFNKERGLLGLVFNRHKEADMLDEEVLELRYAETHEQEIDALGDTIVLAVGAIWKKGYNPDLVLREILMEINSRTGTLNEETGKWEKDKDAHTYRADFTDCKDV